MRTPAPWYTIGQFDWVSFLLQDTVVALRALAKFAENTYTSDIEQSVTFSLPGLSSNVVRAVNKENRFQRFDVEVYVVH